MLSHVVPQFRGCDDLLASGTDGLQLRAALSVLHVRVPVVAHDHCPQCVCRLVAERMQLVQVDIWSVLLAGLSRGVYTKLFLVVACMLGLRKKMPLESKEVVTAESDAAVVGAGVAVRPVRPWGFAR